MKRSRGRIATGLAVVLAAAGIAVGVGSASAAGQVTAVFTKDSDWGTGYQGTYTITNGTDATVTSWRVEFDLPSGTTHRHASGTRDVTQQRQPLRGDQEELGRHARRRCLDVAGAYIGTGGPAPAELHGQRRPVRRWDADHRPEPDRPPRRRHRPPTAAPPTTPPTTTRRPAARRSSATSPSGASTPATTT